HSITATKVLNNGNLVHPLNDRRVVLLWNPIFKSSHLGILLKSGLFFYLPHQTHKKSPPGCDLRKDQCLVVYPPSASGKASWYYCIILLSATYHRSSPRGFHPKTSSSLGPSYQHRPPWEAQPSS